MDVQRLTTGLQNKDTGYCQNLDGVSPEVSPLLSLYV